MSRPVGVSVAAILAAVAGFVVVVVVFQNADSVGELLPAILGPFFTVLGTLAGAVAGQAAGSAGTEAAQEQAARATELATRMQQQVSDMQDRVATVQARYDAVAEVAPPDVIEQARRQNPQAW